MTTIYMFILALLRTLSSKSVPLRVILKNVKRIMHEITVIEKWHILTNILVLWSTYYIQWPLKYSWVLLTQTAVFIDHWIASWSSKGVTIWVWKLPEGRNFSIFFYIFCSIYWFYDQLTIFNDLYSTPGCFKHQL